LSDDEISRLPEEALYMYCATEADLFMGFLAEMDRAHIIGGWYSNQFDFPYLMNRVKKVALQNRDTELGELLSKGFNLVTEPGSVDIYKNYDANEKKDKYHPKIPGKGLVDLLEVYKKYAYIKLPSYNLDHVGKFEFGEGKLKLYADEGSKELSLGHLYNNDWFHYIAYNIRDVALTRDIDRKRGLTSLVLEICGISRIPTNRTVYMSAIIDGALLGFLRPRNMVSLGRHIPDKEKFKGGFVKQPIGVYGNRRIYRHTCCFDVTSEYPSVVCKLNVSNETYVGKAILPIFEDQYASALTRDARDLFPDDDDLIKIDVYGGEPFTMTVKEIMEKLDNYEWSISCDGVLFDLTTPGIFSTFTEEGFGHRKKFKRLYQKHRDMYENTHDEEDKELRDKYFTKQIGWKLILNSGYGQTGSRFSRLYNPHIAQAITSTGQAIVFNGERFINEFFTTHYVNYKEEILEFVQKYNKNITKVPWWDDTIEDRVVTMDTDSVIYTVDDLTEPVFDEYNGLDFNVVDGGNAVKAVEFINKFMLKFIEPSLNTYLNEEFSQGRLRSNKAFHLGFELEGEKTSIGSIFLRKKKYILRLPKHNDDNTWSYDLKVTGYEMKKVNTPPEISSGLKSFVLYIFDAGFRWKDKEDAFLEAIERTITLTDELMRGKPVDVANRLAYSSSVNNIEKYTAETDELFKKGSPVHIKGAILHNWIIDQDKLNIPYIYSGERANILRVKETLPKANSIAFKERFPAEFEKYFEFDVYVILKTNFLNKCKPLFDAFGWEKEWETTLKKLYKLDPDWIHNGMIDLQILSDIEDLTVRQIKPRELAD
jgi:DNA polymerase elongation subunit (family B)